MISITSGSDTAEPNPSHAYDVFNGDADGICALHQLRLAYPKDAALITGVKRDIDLLQKVPREKAIDVTVFDISLDVNAIPLRRILDAGGRVTYFDHHAAQLRFEHPNLRLYWDDSPQVCSSLLVDRYLQGQFRPWAIVAAFGDNLSTVGHKLALEAGLSRHDTQALEDLGLILNYNAYGEKVEDLHIAPDVLYRVLHPFADPLDFISASAQYRLLAEGYRSDADHMESLMPAWQSHYGAIYILPNETWSRRISGVFANRLTSVAGNKSYAVLTEKQDGSYLVSVRSGQPDKRSANEFCACFPGGGGRKASAGINCLPAGDLDKFIEKFSAYFTMNNVTDASRGASAN